MCISVFSLKNKYVGLSCGFSLGAGFLLQPSRETAHDRPTNKHFSAPEVLGGADLSFVRGPGSSELEGAKTPMVSVIQIQKFKRSCQSLVMCLSTI